ncbi:hypothetical protein AC578_6713 [Pseudocercospora eumusae]|uniref:Uncharacterized protein n=1 Tax=Pseudocercospora eumusae TaxID=321146 RepID=A0A139GTG8_9PEZI|nr:hypothetical protein AC578_6713 [Pseudocercospora eumusae]
MVYSFYPSSRSSAEKSFNRADVFKRHLTLILLNARRKSPSITSKKLFSATREVLGICSTCGNTFETLEKHMLPTNVDYDAPTSFDDDEEEDDDNDDVDEEDTNDTTYGSRKAGKGSKLRNRVANQLLEIFRKDDY